MPSSLQLQGLKRRQIRSPSGHLKSYALISGHTRFTVPLWTPHVIRSMDTRFTVPQWTPHVIRSMDIRLRSLSGHLTLAIRSLSGRNPRLKDTWSDLRQRSDDGKNGLWNEYGTRITVKRTNHLIKHCQTRNIRRYTLHVGSQNATAKRKRTFVIIITLRLVSNAEFV